MTAFRTAALALAIAAAGATAMAGGLHFAFEHRTKTMVSEIVNQAFDAALHVSAPSVELALALKPALSDREPVAGSARPAASVTVEQRIGTATSALVRLQETDFAQQ